MDVNALPDMPPQSRLIDARGHRCPVPTLKLRRELAEATPGQIVRLWADDPMAQIDVPHFCHQKGYVLARVHALETGWAFDVVTRP